MTQPAEPTVTPGQYEAVVYFHGIGEQRRYAEIGRLIDALDLYAQEGRDPQDEPGLLRRITGRFDVGRSRENAGDVGHAELFHIPDGPAGSRSARRPQSAPAAEWESTWSNGLRFRVYEAYWAPETAKGVPAREVLLWIGRNLLRPLRLVATRWRTHLRLRMTFLHDLRDDLGVEAWSQLQQASWEFEGPNARRDFRRGSFRQFQKYLEERSGDDTPLAAAASRWRRHVTASALWYEAVLLTVAAAAVLGLVAAAVAVMWVLNSLAGQDWLVDALGNNATASWPNAILVGGTLLLQLGLSTFLSRSFGDVVFWASNRETDVRFEVRSRMLAVGTATLRQVLEDDLCAGVVVVAHSLGTTVAYEALLELGRHNRARNRQHPGGGPLPIAKIDQFITLGSPIDKLHYFVESHVGGGHRYNRLYEELHGDIGMVPFSFNKKPHIHWINIWSKADVISGSLTSPMSMEHSSIRPVDNVEVKTTRFPDPALSHAGYFGDRRTVALMFDTIILGRHSYLRPGRHTEVHGGKEYQVPDELEDVGDIGSDPWARPIQLAIAVVVWLTVLYWMTVPGQLASWVGWVDGALAAALVLGAIVGRIRGLADPLQPVPRRPAG